MSADIPKHNDKNEASKAPVEHVAIQLAVEVLSSNFKHYKRAFLSRTEAQQASLRTAFGKDDALTDHAYSRI